MRPKSENNLYPPLFLAKDARETRKLLAEGADPNFCTNMGRTALCFAHSPRQAEVLIRAGADINGNRHDSLLKTQKVDGFLRPPGKGRHFVLSSFSAPAAPRLAEPSADAGPSGGDHRICLSSRPLVKFSEYMQPSSPMCARRARPSAEDVSSAS